LILFVDLVKSRKEISKLQRNQIFRRAHPKDFSKILNIYKRFQKYSRFSKILLIRSLHYPKLSANFYQKSQIFEIGHYIAQSNMKHLIFFWFGRDSLSVEAPEFGAQMGLWQPNSS